MNAPFRQTGYVMPQLRGGVGPLCERAFRGRRFAEPAYIAPRLAVRVFSPRVTEALPLIGCFTFPAAYAIVSTQSNMLAASLPIPEFFLGDARRAPRIPKEK